MGSLGMGRHVRQACSIDVYGSALNYLMVVWKERLEMKLEMVVKRFFLHTL